MKLKTTFWTLLLGLGGMACALAEPRGANGIWIDPPGWIIQCFVCPDNQTSDCMIAEPVYIQIEHNRRIRTFHVTQLYPVARSERTGLVYHGTLSATVVVHKRNVVTVVLTCHWLREDGLSVHIVRHLRLRYGELGGSPQTEVMQERSSFVCK